FQAEDGIRDPLVTGVQTCALPISRTPGDPARQSGFQAIAPLVEEAIREGKCPGAVVLVGHKGEVIYRRAFGYRQLVPEKRPMERSEERRVGKGCRAGGGRSWCIRE